MSNRTALFFLLLAACSKSAPVREGYQIGHVATKDQIAALDIDVNPTGAGLPAGSGTAAQGAITFAAKCAVCHGANGEGTGALFPKLIDPQPRSGFPFGKDVKLVKTIGNYWPYSTTVFDYIRRAMPLTAPGSLSDQEVYGLVAFLLARNQIISDSTVIDAQSLPKIKMPAHDHFVIDNRRGGQGFQ